MLVTGTRANNVFQELREHLKKGVIVTHPADCDLSGFSGVVLICPSSPVETEKFEQNTERMKCLPVVIGSVEMVGGSYTLPAVYVPESDFGMEFAANLAAHNYVSPKMEDLYHVLHWAKTGTLMSFLVHNMNNVLTRIMGNVELATLFSGDPDKQAEKLEIAVEGSETMRDILSDISKYSKVIEDDGEVWCTAYLDSLLKMAEMSAGNSVEMTVRGIEDNVQFPVQRLKYDSMLGAMFATATLSVAGNGGMEISLQKTEYSIGISIDWTSQKSDDEIAKSFYERALVLMRTLAVLAPSAGTAYVIEHWSRTTGRSLLTVPIED